MAETQVGLDTSDEVLLRKALAWERAGKVSEALDTLEQALQINPQSAMARLRRGFLRVRQNQLSGALDDWDRALEFQPGLTALFDRPEWRGPIDFALQQFVYRTTNEPDSASLQLFLGKACRLFCRYELGLQALLTALHLQPGLLEAEQILHDIFLRLGHGEYAAHTLQKLLETNPGSATLNYQLAWVLHRSNSTAQAVRQLERAIELAPTHWQSLVLLGEILASQGRHEQAYERFVGGLRLNRESTAALMGLARCCRTMFRFEEALQYSRRASDLGPQDAKILAELGSLHLQLGHLEDGLRVLTESWRLDPNQVEVHLDLARALQQNGEPERASEHYSQALKLNPNDDLTAFNLGCLHRGLGKLVEAGQSFRCALALKPQELQYSLHLAQVQLELGQPQEALAGVQAALALYPNHPELTLTAGRARLDSGQLSEAARDLNAALAANPDSADAHALLALAYLGLENPNESQQALSRALELASEHPLAFLAEGRLLMNQGQREQAVSSWLRSLRSDPASRGSIVELARAAQVAELRAAVIEGLAKLVADLAGDARLPGSFLRQWLEALGPIPDYELGGQILDLVCVHRPEHENLKWLLARWHLGWARRLKDGGDLTGARDSVNRLLAHQPQHPEGLALLESLEAAALPVEPPRQLASPLAAPVPKAEAAPEPPAAKRNFNRKELRIPTPSKLRRVAERLLEFEAPSDVDAVVAQEFAELSARLEAQGYWREAAVVLLRECLGREPDNERWELQWIELMQRSIEGLIEQGRRDQAAQLTGLWLELYPEHPEASQYGSRLQPPAGAPPRKLEEPDPTAVSELRGRVQQSPGDETNREALYALLKNDPASLVRIYKELASEFPDEPLHALNLARAYVHTGSDSLAVHQYRRFLKSRPTPDAYGELAQAYQRLGKSELAATTLKKAKS